MRTSKAERRCDLEGHVCLVTGGAQGIGWAITKALATAGAQVHACDISEESLARAARDLADTVLDSRVTLQRLDVTDRTAMERWTHDVHELTGHLDVLVNNAVFTRWADVEEMTVEEAELSMRTAFDALLYGVTAVLPLMRAGRHGHIVSMSSVAGLVFTRGPSAAYAAAKAAVEAYSQILRIEMAQSPISVTVVRPGTVGGTEFFGKHVPSRRMPRIADFLPAAQPGQVAEAVVHAIRHGRGTVDIPRYLPLLYWAHTIAPQTLRRVVAAGGGARGDFSRSSTDEDTGMDIPAIPPPAAYPPAPWRSRGTMWAGLLNVQRPLPVPAGFSPLLDPRRLALLLIRYREGTLRYDEFMTGTPVRHGFRTGLWVQSIWVDNPASLWGGRRIWGVPKEMATFSWTDDGVRLTGIRGTVAALTLRSRSRWSLPMPLLAPGFGLLDDRVQYFLGRLWGGVAPATMHITSWSEELPALSARTTWPGIRVDRFRMTVGKPRCLSRVGLTRDDRGPQSG